MMPNAEKLTIVIVSAFYSEGMGYSENCLSRALARLGHDVHVIASTYNVYGNDPMYDATYREFLGPRHVPVGTRLVDGYHVHRLESDLLSGYVRIKGMAAKVREIHPDIVHSLEVGSIQTWELALLKPLAGFKMFTETHQTLSVMRPYMLDPRGSMLKRLTYRLTRTVPTWLAAHTMELCYAVTPDCGEVAMRFYGVPASKIKYLSLGADTETFHPAVTEAERTAREQLRAGLGFGSQDVLCVYTGRFTKDKNPLVLAKAIDALSRIDPRYKGLFIGDGVQKAEIAACANVTVVPFMNHQRLAEHYRAADIGIWPRQESMSMIDAAASGVPLVVSDRIGEPGRVEGNGKMYEENSVDSLIAVLQSFGSPAERQAYGAIGRRKMLSGFNWTSFARTLEADFLAALGRRRRDAVPAAPPRPVPVATSSQADDDAQVSSDNPVPATSDE
jgi:glycosyltransferase involved in cell wall biosynthesis